jgi:hypothetical protein
MRPKPIKIAKYAKEYLRKNLKAKTTRTQRRVPPKAPSTVLLD